MIVDSKAHLRVYLVGKYFPVFHYFNDPVTMIFRAPIACNVWIKKIEFSIMFFGIVFIMIMAVKDRPDIRIFVK